MSDGDLQVIAKAARRDSLLRSLQNLVLSIPAGMFMFFTVRFLSDEGNRFLFWIPLLFGLPFLYFAGSSLRKNPLFLARHLRRAPERVTRVAFGTQRIKGLEISCVLVDFQDGRSFPISVAEHHRDPSTDDIVRALRNIAPQADFTGAGPEDEEVSVDIELREAVFGCQRTLRKGTRTISLKIPSGIETGQQLRLRGEGEPLPFSSGPTAERGDLFVTINVKPDDTFRREGDDLLVEVPLRAAQRGHDVEVPSLDGMLKASTKGAVDGTRYAFSGYGVPNLQTHVRGRLIVTLRFRD